jgi:hypothetical protein
MVTANAQRVRDFRARKAAGLCLLGVEIPEHDARDLLRATGFLPHDYDRKALEEGLAALVTLAAIEREQIP